MKTEEEFHEAILSEFDGREDFEEGYALSWLIKEDHIFLNGEWHFYVNCNDVFAWSCGDSEPLKYHDIRSLYDFCKKDSIWGGALWTIKKRKMMPQNPVVIGINKSGLWNMEKLKVEWQLEENHYDKAHREHKENLQNLKDEVKRNQENEKS